MKVFKYRLPEFNEGSFSLSLPEGAKILTVQVHQDWPNIWALVSPDNPDEIRKFLLTGTGREIREKDLRYIGTVQEKDGEYVWHLFEVGK